MLDRRSALVSLAAGAIGTGVRASAKVTPQSADNTQHVTRLANAAFRVEIDGETGALASITHSSDKVGMSWVAGPANAPWQSRGSLWGLGFADLGEHLLHKGRWDQPISIRRDEDTVIVTYRIGDLQIDVERRLRSDTLDERYTFHNLGTTQLSMRARGKASLAIYTPCNDHYTSTEDVLEHRAHAHIWTGGHASWIAMLRMGGRGPHLGLVLTEGSLDGYSVEDRDQITSSNTRGTILVHPVLDYLAPGQSSSVSWTMFWHEGWNDFFVQALRRSKQMVQVSASDWTYIAGESATLTFQGDLGPNPSLTVGDLAVPLRQSAEKWTAKVSESRLGEHVATLRYGDGLTTRAVLNTIADVSATLAARVDFITRRQQWHKPLDPWDGAYIVFDNEADVPARWEKWSDYNAGRERVAMGVLVARWLKQHGRQDPAARQSLDRYYAFINSKLQRADGYVLDGPEQPRKRLYNWPWVMQLHLAMAELTGETEPLQKFVQTVTSYYREGGAEFYPIGLPVADGLRKLEVAGMGADHERVLALFTAHGKRIIARGTAYPASEVNFEQSIVAPAALILLELHSATRATEWIEAAKPHLALLELFEGRQPDHHLHGISIRHWDGYWFGKERMWGDTFPHYWSSLNALAWQMLSRATNSSEWAIRARTTLRNNLSLFQPDGSATAAFIYPVTVNGRTGYFADPYANDQDWALVHLLQMSAESLKEG